LSAYRGDSALSRIAGRGHHHHARGRIEFVHLRWQLIQGLLALVMTAQPRTDVAGTADRIQAISGNTVK
jgi:hypothetical protein